MSLTEMFLSMVFGAIGGLMLCIILAAISLLLKRGRRFESMKPYRVFYVPLGEGGYRFRSILVEARNMDEAIETFIKRSQPFDIAYIVEANMGVMVVSTKNKIEGEDAKA